MPSLFLRAGGGELIVKPRAGHAPFALHGRRRNAHYFGRLLHREPAEEAKFHEFGLIGVQHLQTIQRFVQFVEGHFGNGGDSDVVFNGENLDVAAAFLGALVAGVVDENSAHQLRGDAEKVGAALPVHAGLIHQLHVRLVNERGGLQGVVATFAAHVVGGDSPEFRVDDRKELIVCSGCALARVGEKLGDFAAGLWSHRW